MKPKKAPSELTFQQVGNLHEEETRLLERLERIRTGSFTYQAEVLASVSEDYERRLFEIRELIRRLSTDYHELAIRLQTAQGNLQSLERLIEEKSLRRDLREFGDGEYLAQTEALLSEKQELAEEIAFLQKRLEEKGAPKGGVEAPKPVLAPKVPSTRDSKPHLTVAPGEDLAGEKFPEPEPAMSASPKGKRSEEPEDFPAVPFPEPEERPTQILSSADIQAFAAEAKAQAEAQKAAARQPLDEEQRVTAEVSEQDLVGVPQTKEEASARLHEMVDQFADSTPDIVDSLKKEKESEKKSPPPKDPSKPTATISFEVDEKKAEEARAAGHKPPFLRIMTGSAAQREFIILKDTVSIGRVGENDIKIENDSSVSRHHSEIQKRGNDYFINDLGSSNGTFLNGTRIKHARLLGGDIIRIGLTALMFVNEE